MAKETQEFIVDKAQPLFYRYGIRSVTMDFIASELGMSKRTLYENFENKEALIIACMEKGRKAQEQDMCAIFNSDANIIEKLLRCYNRIMYHINKTSRSFQLDVELKRPSCIGKNNIPIYATFFKKVLKMGLFVPILM